MIVACVRGCTAVHPGASVSGGGGAFGQQLLRVVAVKPNSKLLTPAIKPGERGYHTRSPTDQIMY